MIASKPLNKLGKLAPNHDRAYDPLRSDEHPLDAIFAPHSVAVIGATEKPGSIGRAVVWSLLSSPFGGTVYPVNDKRTSVLGIKAYPQIADIPEPVDLAMVVTPAVAVPDIISQCVEAGVRGVIVISSGFKEHGEKGQDLERQILERMQGSRLRLLGPNCMGVMNPIGGLNATFAPQCCPAGQCRLHQPERRLVHRGFGLVPAADGRLQRLRFRGLDVGRGLGRPD